MMVTYFTTILNQKSYELLEKRQIYDTQHVKKS